MTSTPLVSCIMPTRGRPEFASDAMGYWLAQTWSAKELIVIDDKLDPSFLEVHVPGVRHIVTSRRLSIGCKRNIGCAGAQGEILCHWDDDDFSAPGRLEDQVRLLLESGAEVTGYHTMRFKAGLDWYEFAGPQDYCIGTSLMFRRSYWLANPFPDRNVSEDNAFIQAARGSGRIVCADAGDLMYATVHPGNTSPRQLNRKPYRRIS